MLQVQIERARAARRFGSELLRVVRRRRRQGPLLPSWPLAYEVAVQFMRQSVLETGLESPERLRALHDALVVPTRALRRVRRSAAAGPVPATWFVPEATGPGCVLYFHGGAYVFGSSRTHGDFISRLAVASQTRILSVDYRLAPEHPFPAALEDALAAHAWLAGQSGASEGIVVSGDSAGGGLALSMLLAERGAGVPNAAGLVLVSPWVLMGTQSPSSRQNLAFDWAANAQAVDRWQEWYLGCKAGSPARVTARGPANFDNPLVSPLLGALRDLPPTLVHVGGGELLHDDVLEFTRLAREAGVQVTLEVWPELVHNFHFFLPYLSTAGTATAALGRFIRACLRGAAR
jgi:acetyl esterase/lipase